MRHGTFQSPQYEADRPGPSQIWTEAGDGENVGSGTVHAHSGVEIGVVLRGQQQIRFSSLDLTCQRGDVWMVNMWEPHAWRIPPPGITHVVLVVAPEFIGDELAGEVPWMSLFTVPPSERPRVVSEEMRTTVLDIGRTMFREIRERRPHWRSVLRLEMIRLLVEMRRSWDSESLLPMTEGGTHARAFQRVMPALSLLNTEPRRRISLAEAASSCGLSPSRFHTLFHEAMGVSFSTLALRSRVSAAAQLLAHTDRSVGAIADECGFSHDSHLHRHFVQAFGCTPKQYRERRAQAEFAAHGSEGSELAPGRRAAVLATGVASGRG